MLLSYVISSFMTHYECNGWQLTPGQYDVSERNEVHHKSGCTQGKYGQPAEERHSPIESTENTEKSEKSMLFPSTQAYPSLHQRRATICNKIQENPL